MNNLRTTTKLVTPVDSNVRICERYLRDKDPNARQCCLIPTFPTLFLFMKVNWLETEHRVR